MNIPDADDPNMWDRVMYWWQGPNHNPCSMDEDLLDWVLTHHPNWIKISVKQKWLNQWLKDQQAAGKPILPDSLSGLRLTRRYRNQSIDEN
jgi:hypothetical protein